MVRLEMKNWNMILTEKQQRYQHCNQEKLINTNIYTGKDMASSGCGGVTSSSPTFLAFVGVLTKCVRKTS